ARQGRGGGVRAGGGGGDGPRPERRGERRGGPRGGPRAEDRRGGGVHELSLSSAIVNTGGKHAAGRRGTSVHMRIGAPGQVVPDSLDFYFDIVARDTVCEGAALEQDLIPARLCCGGCEREWKIDFPIFRCEDCGGTDVTVMSGDEFEVESIDVEEVAC